MMIANSLVGIHFIHLKSFTLKLANSCKLLLILLWLISGCTFQKRYIKEDYSFYSEDFKLGSITPIRTDGVYVSDKIEIDATSGKQTMRKDKRVYKFYPTGQVNMVLDLNNELKSDEDYRKAFNRRITEISMSKAATLFEGYYQIKENKMVIQFVNQPLRQFYYTYAYLAEKQFIIVNKTHVGRGKIKDKYYTSNYKESYRFEPKTVDDYLEPNW
jgi:hypothetical protein